jgi:hypothetical protein
MARVAVYDLIGWTLTMRAVARIPEPLANPAKTSPTPSRLRAASAEGPPTWNYVVGRFPNGARARSWPALGRPLAPRAQVSNTPWRLKV